MYRFTAMTGLLFLLNACAGYNPEEDYDLVIPARLNAVQVVDSHYPEEQVERGRYLADLLACGTCHTVGALAGEPDQTRYYGGSDIGIAYTSPFEGNRPGILYPANITSDPETGIGRWTDEEIMRLIRTGVDRHGSHNVSVMPWQGYTQIVDEDAMAIVAFLRSLKPVIHKVPANVLPGQKHSAPFVHFGVYRSKN